MGTVEEFWSSECPERAGGLTHAHWNRCVAPNPHPGEDAVHQPYQCCHCAALVPGIIRHGGLSNAGGSLTELIQRLNGTPAKPEPQPTEAPTPSKDELTEPKMALGHPVGPPWGPGRSWWGDGRLNPRDYPRLRHIIWKEERDGYR